MIQKLVQNHQQKFNMAPDKRVFAPGRVNFIGEHTDYNGGWVMPLALDKGIYAAVSKNGSRLLRIQSLDYNAYAEFDIDTLKPDTALTWANGPKGIVSVIRANGHTIEGFDLTLTGNIPIGAGLSSSAAVEVAVGFAVKELFGLSFDNVALAKMSQKAEHAFTGTKCGIMDPMISVLGKEKMLLTLSCADLSYLYSPLELGDAALLIVNSKVKHHLAESAYNKRREECAEIMDLLCKAGNGLKNLSDYSLDALKAANSLLPPVLYRRLHHVLSENERVQQVSYKLKGKNLKAVGELLTQSHISLRDNYEVSCEELDWLVDNALAVTGVYGARMTGGGFGGCVIVLLKKKSRDVYKKSLDGYRARFNVLPEIYEAVPSAGVRVI
ncbi:MAG: galactokinase [Fibrobacterota bacterium]